MAIINPSDLTFSGMEVQQLSESIITDFYANPSLTEFHTLVKGIKAKKQIAILGLLGLSGKTQEDCDWTPNLNSIGASQKFWDPAYIGDRWEICWTTLKETFFIWGLNNGVTKPDLTSTDFANFLNERVSQSMEDAVLRNSWFSDTAAANFNSSPAGVIKNGTDLDYFNSIDGFWKQIFVIVTARPDAKTTIANNSAGTYALQKFDATDTTNQVATGYFQAMIDGADERLADSSEGIIIATRSLVQQYKRERRQFSNIDEAYKRTETGWEYIEIDGKQVYPFSFMDRTIKAYFDNGTKYYLPHRAVYTTKANLQIGTEEESDLSTLDTFYDKKSKNYYVDYGFNLDAKIIEDYKIQTAY